MARDTQGGILHDQTPSPAPRAFGARGGRTGGGPGRRGRRRRLAGEVRAKGTARARGVGGVRTAGAAPVKPPVLRPGDRVAVVAPAGPATPDVLAAGLKVLESLGLRVTLGRHVEARNGYLAGPDEARAEDLARALGDPDVRGVFFARGGYGSMRILPLVDLSVLKRDPKVIVGSSDVTALHLAVQRAAGLVTFHGPNVESLGRGVTRFTLDCLARAVMTAAPLDVLPLPEGWPPPKVLSPGRATGVLAGGNLSLVAALLGTPYEPDTRGRVLVLEDVGERPYRVDRLLTQLRLAGKLDRTAAVALGEFVDCRDPEESGAPGRARPETGLGPEMSLGSETGPASLPGELPPTVDGVLADRLAGLGVPVISGLPCGHGLQKWTLPLGVTATLDGYKGRLAVEESACVSI
ncbi:MAG: LD-carboxypeptidase [Firmicutes bacterium]|nr:LD-carboxypeptidase [Bacillota bacterium]